MEPSGQLLFFFLKKFKFRVHFLSSIPETAKANLLAVLSSFLKQDIFNCVGSILLKTEN
jgi:hypothetical protein